MMQDDFISFVLLSTIEIVCCHEGFALLPPAVCLVEISFQLFQFFRSESLNGLLMVTSSGCKQYVKPPGIKIGSI